MPTTLSANLNATVIMLSDQASDMTLYRVSPGLAGGTLASPMPGFDPDACWAPVVEGCVALDTVKSLD